MKRINCPDCDRLNNRNNKKCVYCGAVLNYGKNYYKFKYILLNIAIAAGLLFCGTQLLVGLDIIDGNFFEYFPNWALWLYYGFLFTGVICGFVYRLADFDEFINE